MHRTSSHNSHLEPLPELYLCGKVISRLHTHTHTHTHVHVRDDTAEISSRRVNVTVYLLISGNLTRYASWFFFLLFHTLRECHLNTMEISCVFFFLPIKSSKKLQRDVTRHRSSHRKTHAERK